MLPPRRRWHSTINNPSGDFQEEPSCLLFDCPEFKEEISLAEDDVYDYYSLYADPMPDSNVSCVPKVGMFKLHKERMNFTAAQEICAEEGGHLANVLSEQKTNALSGLIATFYSGRGKHLVYVGLHDMDMEGQYVNMKDEPMDCFNWRAWAPNQPRSKYKTEDCVVLTTDKNWKVVNCSQQMPFLCELQPRGPYNLCEEEPAYCELGDGPPEIPTVSDEPPSLDPDEHPDIIEIPIPGVSSLNGSDTDIETTDIKNTSESTNTKIKDDKSPGSQTETNDGRPDNSTTPEDSSETNETQENYETPLSQGNMEGNSKPMPPEKEQTQNSNFNAGTQLPNNRPFQNTTKPDTGNQWGPQTTDNSTQNNDNKRRPVSIQGTHSGNRDQNWKPNKIGNQNWNKKPNGDRTYENWKANLTKENEKPEHNAWKPVFNPNNKNPQNENGPQIGQNSDGENAMSTPANQSRPPNKHEGNTLWRPSNQESEYPHIKSEQPPDMPTNWYHTEHSQDENENDSHKKPSPNHNNNDPDSFENESWRPEHFSINEPEHENGWKPQGELHPNNVGQNNWKPENFGNEDPDEKGVGWRPQNTETSDPNVDSWRPQGNQDHNGIAKPNWDNSEQNNWKPENFDHEGNDEQAQGWRPQNSGNREPNTHDFRPHNTGHKDANTDWINQNTGHRNPNTNNWRPENVENEGPDDQRPGWIPQNTEHRDPNTNDWRPENFDNEGSVDQGPSWKPQNTGYKDPNANNWRPQNTKHRDPNTNDWRPENFDNEGPVDQGPGWKPQNTGYKVPNRNEWRPHDENQATPNDNLGEPENLDNEDPNEERPIWRPQNTGYRDPNANDWIPGDLNNEDHNNQQPCSRPQNTGIRVPDTINEGKPDLFCNEYTNDQKAGWKPGNREPNLINWKQQEGNQATPSLNASNFDNWRPENLGYEDPNDQKPGWRPQNTGRREPNTDDWRPVFGKEDTNSYKQKPGWSSQYSGHMNPVIGYPDQNPDNEQQLGWEPQKTEHRDPNENTWRPLNGDKQNQHECNDWIPQNHGKNPFNSGDVWKPGESDQNVRNCNENEWVPQNLDEENQTSLTTPKDGLKEESNGMKRPNNNNQDFELNTQTKKQKENSDSTIGTEMYNQSLDNFQEENDSTRKLIGNRLLVNEITHNKDLAGGSRFNNNVQRGQANNNRINERNNVKLVGGNLNENPGLPKIQTQNFEQKQNETRVLNRNTNKINNNQPNSSKNEMNFKHKHVLFSVNNNTDIGTSTPNITAVNKRGPKALLMARQGYDANESFIVFGESKTSSKTIKAPLNKGLNHKAEDNNTMDNSTNKTKAEDKKAPVTIKLRDTETKKCRAVTFNPN